MTEAPSEFKNNRFAGKHTNIGFLDPDQLKQYNALQQPVLDAAERVMPFADLEKLGSVHRKMLQLCILKGRSIEEVETMYRQRMDKTLQRPQTREV